MKLEQSKTAGASRSPARPVGSGRPKRVASQRDHVDRDDPESFVRSSASASSLEIGNLSESNLTAQRFPTAR